MIHKLCHQEHQLEATSEECSSYLKHKDLFYGDKFAFVSLGNAIQFPLPLNSCLVFQFHSRNAAISSDNDEAEIKLLAVAMRIQSEAVMMLKGRLHNIGWIRVTDLELSSEYCFLSQAPQKLHCVHNDQISGGSLPKQTFEKISNQVENIFLMLKTKTPSPPNQFPISAQFFPQTYSWLDIIVERTAKINSSIYPREVIPYVQSGTCELQRLFTDQLYALFVTVQTNYNDTVLRIKIDAYENPNYWTDSFFEVDMNLLELENVLGVSLGAKISNVKITVIRSVEDFYERLVVTAIWVHDIFNDYISYLDEIADEINDQSLNKTRYKLHLNFSSFMFEQSVASRNYFLLSQEFTLFRTGKIYINSLLKGVLYLDRHTEAMSWEDSSQLCAESGGYLPYFTSREELKEMISLVKLSKEVPPISALFIGLSFDPQVKVFLLNIWCNFNITVLV